MVRFDECPNCGARFKHGRLACPECGSDATTGWRSAEDIDYESVEIPDSWDEETYGPSRGPKRWLVLAAFMALVAMAALILLLR